MSAADDVLTAARARAVALAAADADRLGILLHAVEGEKDPETYRMPMTQFWVRTDLGWQCLAGHAGPRLEA